MGGECMDIFPSGRKNNSASLKRHLRIQTPRDIWGYRPMDPKESLQPKC